MPLTSSKLRGLLYSKRRLAGHRLRRTHLLMGC